MCKALGLIHSTTKMKKEEEEEREGGKERGRKEGRHYFLRKMVMVGPWIQKKNKCSVCIVKNQQKLGMWLSDRIFAYTYKVMDSISSTTHTHKIKFKNQQYGNEGWMTHPWKSTAT
jgi:hypothetical protein